jgi:hypothetical protein
LTGNTETGKVDIKVLDAESLVLAQVGGYLFRSAL